MGNKSLAITKYNTVPADRVARDMFVFYSNSIGNGYSSDWAAMYETSKYCPSGDMEGILRNSLTTLLNRANNFGGPNHFGNEVCCGVDAKESGEFTDPLILYTHYINGIYLIEGDAAETFSAYETGGYWDSFMLGLYNFFRRCKLLGVVPTIRLFNHADVTNEAFNHSVQDFTDNINYMNLMFRTNMSEFGGSNIPAVWAQHHNIALPGNNQGGNYRDGLTAVALTDSKHYNFDLFAHYPYANDGYHPRTHATRNAGKLNAAVAIHHKTGGAFPVVTNVTVSGTLRQNQYITAAYTYSNADGNIEGDTEIEVIYGPDDVGVSGGVVYTGLHIKGAQGYQLPLVTVGKYIQVRVIPISQTGVKTGFAVCSPWQGPVIAL